MRGLAVLTSLTLATVATWMAPLLVECVAQAPNNNATIAAVNPADLIPMLDIEAIPYYYPGDAEANVVLDPLAPAVTPAPTSSRPRVKRHKHHASGDTDTSSSSSGDGTDSPSPTPTLPPTPTPMQTPSLTPVSVFPGLQCTANYTYGPVAVSIEGGGIFCAFSPVCSGNLLGNCPLLQPGLGRPSRCEIVYGGVYGCVP